MKKVLGCLGVGIGLMVIVGIIGAVIGITKTDQSTASASVDRDQPAASPSEPTGAEKPKPSSNGGGGSKTGATPEVAVDSAAIRSKREAVSGKTFATLTLGERQFSNATVTGIDDLGIKLRHEAGMASMQWDQVSGEVQDQWGYDPGAFKRAVAAKEKAEEEAAKQRTEMAEAAQKQQEEAQKQQREAKQAEIDKEFMQTSLNAGWVVHIEKANPGLNQFHVRLPAEKYTTKENVEKIAEFIARSFVMQSQNKGGDATSATVHVWEGDKVLVRGSYRK